MAVEIKHATQATGTDSGTGEIRKAQWNEGHSIQMSGPAVVGRAASGTGPATEISIDSTLTLSGGSLGVTPNSYQPLDSELTAIAGLSSAANKLPYFTGSGSAALTDITPFARQILDDSDAASVRGTLGLDSTYQPLDAELTAIAGLNSAANKLPYFTGSGAAALTDITPFARQILDDQNADEVKATLGIGSGGEYQPVDSELTAIAGLASAADTMPYFTGSGTAALTTLTSSARQLLDDATFSDMRTTLQLSSYYQPLATSLTALSSITPSSDALPYFTGSSTASSTTLSSFMRTLLDDTSATAAHTTLQLSSYFQPLDDQLTALAGVSASADRVPYFTSSTAAGVFVMTSFCRGLMSATTQAGFRSSIGAAASGPVASSGITVSKACVVGNTASGSLDELELATNDFSVSSSVIYPKNWRCVAKAVTASSATLIEASIPTTARAVRVVFGNIYTLSDSTTVYVRFPSTAGVSFTANNTAGSCGDVTFTRRTASGSEWMMDAKVCDSSGTPAVTTSKVTATSNTTIQISSGLSMASGVFYSVFVLEA